MSNIHSENKVISYIRNHPEAHFISGVPNIEESVSSLVQESIREGNTKVKIEKMNDRWLVFFNKDWITPLGIDKYFNTLIKYDVGRAGGCRVGIILSAFASELVFYADNSAKRIKGNIEETVQLEYPYICCLSISI